MIDIKTTNDTIDPAVMCQRYQESMSREMLVKFERLLFERFGVTPLTAIPSSEAAQIYRELFLTEWPDNAGGS